jgi:hypothetical protein
MPVSPIPRTNLKKTKNGKGKTKPKNGRHAQKSEPFPFNLDFVGVPGHSRRGATSTLGQFINLLRLDSARQVRLYFGRLGSTRLESSIQPDITALASFPLPPGNLISPFDIVNPPPRVEQPALPPSFPEHPPKVHQPALTASNPDRILATTLPRLHRILQASPHLHRPLLILPLILHQQLLPGSVSLLTYR